MREFDSLARQLAQGDISRRRCLRLIGGLGAAAGLTTLGVGRAIAQEDDPMTTSGYTVSQLASLRERAPQATCARVPPFPPNQCPLIFCSTTCPEGLLNTAVCLEPAYSRGSARCVGVVTCAETPECTTNADCGPREFCAVTCCPGGARRCTPLCAEDPHSEQVPV